MALFSIIIDNQHFYLVSMCRVNQATCRSYRSPYRVIFSCQTSGWDFSGSLQCLSRWRSGVRGNPKNQNEWNLNSSWINYIKLLRHFQTIFLVCKGLFLKPKNRLFYSWKPHTPLSFSKSRHPSWKQKCRTGNYSQPAFPSIDFADFGVSSVERSGNGDSDSRLRTSDSRLPFSFSLPVHNLGLHPYRIFVNVLENL